MAGGFGNSNNTLATAELYDAPSGTFSLASSMIEHGASDTATLLSYGTVLVAGEGGLGGPYPTTAEIYNPTDVTTPSPASLQITPATANVLVGGSQQFNALDNHGVPRQDATWFVSNPSVATVTTDGDGNGFLTGVAAGQVTL